jgi:seryl-tRNA synthetase
VFLVVRPCPPPRDLEFQKIEQFSFEKTKAEALLTLLEFMENTQKFLSSKCIKHRVVDQTKDEGYHEIKMDIEIETKTFGWIEVGSYTYFGQEQSKRFDITGATHTVSGTGLAFPRVLIPIIENVKDSESILG